MLPLKPSEVYNFVINAIKCKRIPYVSGPPGIGKSDIIFKVAKDLELFPIDVRLSQKLPEDLSGLPTMDPATGKAKYVPFDTFPMEGDTVPSGYVGWLIFLDELSSASDEVWAAIYSLLLGHSIGGMKIHSRAVIVAAGNRETDSAIARRLPDTLITRLLPCTMKSYTEDWLNNWAKKLGAKANQDVIEYIERYPEQLHSNIIAENREELETFPTPRGWGTCFNIMNLHEKESLKRQITIKDSSAIPIGIKDKKAPISNEILALLNAAVGSMAASSFKDHYNAALVLPQPWEVAQSPSSTPIPGTAAGCAEIVEILATYFVKVEDNSRNNVLVYINRIDKDEYRQVFVHHLQNILGETSSDKAMIEEVKKRLSIDTKLANEPINPFHVINTATNNYVPQNSPFTFMYDSLVGQVDYDNTIKDILKYREKSKTFRGSSFTKKPTA